MLSALVLVRQKCLLARQKCLLSACQAKMPACQAKMPVCHAKMPVCQAKVPGSKIGFATTLPHFFQACPGLDIALDSLHQIKTDDVLKALMNLDILEAGTCHYVVGWALGTRLTRVLTPQHRSQVRCATVLVFFILHHIVVGVSFCYVWIYQPLMKASQLGSRSKTDGVVGKVLWLDIIKIQFGFQRRLCTNQLCIMSYSKFHWQYQTTQTWRSELPPSFRQSRKHSYHIHKLDLRNQMSRHQRCCISPRNLKSIAIILNS